MPDLIKCERCGRRLSSDSAGSIDGMICCPPCFAKRRAELKAEKEAQKQRASEEKAAAEAAAREAAEEKSRQRAEQARQAARELRERQAAARARQQAEPVPGGRKDPGKRRTEEEAGEELVELTPLNDDGSPQAAVPRVAAVRPPSRPVLQQARRRQPPKSSAGGATIVGMVIGFVAIALLFFTAIRNRASLVIFAPVAGCPPGACLGWALHAWLNAHARDSRRRWGCASLFLLVLALTPIWVALAMVLLLGIEPYKMTFFSRKLDDQLGLVMGVVMIASFVGSIVCGIVALTRQSVEFQPHEDQPNPDAPSKPKAKRKPLVSIANILILLVVALVAGFFLNLGVAGIVIVFVALELLRRLIMRK